ncbi:MAG: hypothetical protein ACLSVD_08835 [Eggerthellaceae bacterium]
MRGQNLLGYRNYAGDRSRPSGSRWERHRRHPIFDAERHRNLTTSIRAAGAGGDPGRHPYTSECTVRYFVCLANQGPRRR